MDMEIFFIHVCQIIIILCWFKLSVLIKPILFGLFYEFFMRFVFCEVFMWYMNIFDIHITHKKSHTKPRTKTDLAVFRKDYKADVLSF